jgi:hypothetical protein
MERFKNRVKFGEEMGLEDLLAPLKTVKKYTLDVADEWILKQYTKVTNRWELSGRSKYELAAKIDGPGFLIPMAYGFIDMIRTSGAPVPAPEPHTHTSLEHLTVYGIIAFALASNVLIMQNFLHTRYNLYKNRSDVGTDLAEDPYNYVQRGIHRAVRLPLFMGFSALTGYGVVQNATQGDLEGVTATTMGLLMYFSTASSMYIKDSNPKLLQKVPAWKRALNWVKEKAQDYLPQPEPLPAPVSYQVLPSGKI